MRNILRTPPSNYSSAAIKAFSITGAGLIIASGVFGFLSLDITRAVLNIYKISFGSLFIISEFYAISLFGYVSFIYTPFGRACFFVFFGSIIIGENLANTIFGIITIIIGVVVYIWCATLKGVPKPYFQRNFDELPLNSNITFVQDNNNSTMMTPSAPITL